MKNKILREMICSVQQSENIDLEMVVSMVVLMFFNEFEPCSFLSFYQILFPNLKGKALVLQFLCDIQSERLHKLRYYDSCHNGWIMVHKDIPHYFINEDGFVWSIDWIKVNEGIPKDDDFGSRGGTTESVGACRTVCPVRTAERVSAAERMLWFGAGKTHGRPKGGHAGECVFGGYSVGCRCSSSSRSMLAAAAAARSMFCVRRRAKTDLQARVPCGVASPIHTVPTGFSGVPPVGPATPVVERA